MTLRSRPSTQLLRDQAVARSTMEGRGQVLVYTAGTVDAHGIPSSTWTAGSEIRIGISRPRTQEVEDTLPAADWEIRLPYGTAITSQDRVLITRYGDAAVSITTEVVGEVHKGRTAVQVNVARVNRGG